MGKIYSLSEGVYNIEKELKKEYKGINVFQDPYLRFYEELIDELEKGNNIATIRFKKDYIRIPGVNDEYMLPIAKTTLENPTSGQLVGQIQIPKIYIAIISDYPEMFFQMAGYPTKKLGIESLSDTYNYKLKDTNILSLYWIHNFEKKIF